MPGLKKLADIFLFSSLYISLVAVFMVFQTYTLLLEQPVNRPFLAFVFFSTVCSYNFHWMLTPHSVHPSARLNWSYQHKGLHLVLFLTGLSLSALLFYLYLTHYWRWICLAAILTFLYSAPKISLPPFLWLKKFAIGKTIFLALVWTYVTTALPLFIEHAAGKEKMLSYFLGEFFFIYAICILFDYRDRKDDIAEGIRSMITYFQDKGITRLFAMSVMLSAFFFLALWWLGMQWTWVILLLFPLILLVFLFPVAKKNYSDYLYYFILDGLMMLSGFVLWIMSHF